MKITTTYRPNGAARFRPRSVLDLRTYDTDAILRVIRACETEIAQRTAVASLSPGYAMRVVVNGELRWDSRYGMRGGGA